MEKIIEDFLSYKKEHKKMLDIVNHNQILNKTTGGIIDCLDNIVKYYESTKDRAYTDIFSFAFTFLDEHILTLETLYNEVFKNDLILFNKFSNMIDDYIFFNELYDSLARLGFKKLDKLSQHCTYLYSNISSFNFINEDILDNKYPEIIDYIEEKNNKTIDLDEVSPTLYFIAFDMSLRPFFNDEN